MNRTVAGRLVALGATLLAVWPAPAAQELPAQAITTSPMRRVRPVKVAPYDPASLLEEASRLSPTIRDTLNALEESNVIVWVELRDQMPVPNACLLLLGASRDSRRLHILVSARNHDLARITWLGHELWHALEISQAPDVRDADSMASLYQRIGRASGSGSRYFETEAAIEAGKRVQREVELAMDTQRRPDRLKSP